MAKPSTTWVDNIDVAKSNVRGLLDGQVRIRFASIAALQAETTGAIAMVDIAGDPFDADFADTTSVDDGNTVILSSDNVRFKRVLTNAALSPNGANISFAILEEEVTCSGASVDTTIQIPDRAIVFGVSTRTTLAVTGATSYDCGISGEVGKYGATLGAALNSTNSGVTGPTAFFAATAIRLTANGGNFTGGKVRVAIHYLLAGVPTT